MEKATLLKLRMYDIMFPKILTLGLGGIGTPHVVLFSVAPRCEGGEKILRGQLKVTPARR